MPVPARRRILDAALSLIQWRGIGRVTTKEIGKAAGAAEAACSRTSGDKCGCSPSCCATSCPRTRHDGPSPPRHH